MSHIPGSQPDPGNLADQDASDADQTSSDADQTSSDADQSTSDRDQAAAESDQRTSDLDQEAADLELMAHPSDTKRKRVHDKALAKRDEGTLTRSATAVVRAQISSERDEQAACRDEAAHLRDQTATMRDSSADLTDREAEEIAQAVKGGNLELADALKAASAARSKAASARLKAAEDRRHAAHDRKAAAEDREQLRAEIERSQLDELTGAYRRGIGEVLLRHEIERARRSTGSLALAFIDVDNLKKTNDDLGHAAGDTVLRTLFTVLQGHLRPYDPIIRWGGDEFVCVIPSATVEEARNRIEAAQAELTGLDPVVSVSAGFASLQTEDTLTTIVDRADLALLKTKQPSSPEDG